MSVKNRCVCAMVLMIGGLLWAPTEPLLGQAGAWTGWITDEKCGPKGPSLEHKDCTLKAAKDGGKVVLYDVDTKRHLPLDDQELAQRHIGYLVTVRGSIKGNAITVASIERAPEARAAAAGSVTGTAGIGASQVLCTALSPDALGRTTSRAYTTTNSQFDNATLKHCEYRGGADVVSVTLALGAGARERFDTSTKFPGVQAVPGIGDLANWEPVRGTLSVFAGMRSVEVRVSPSHGTAVLRQEHARRIAALVLGR